MADVVCIECRHKIKDHYYAGCVAYDKNGKVCGCRLTAMDLKNPRKKK